MKARPVGCAFLSFGGLLMDVAKAFTFVTEDEKWVGKIGVGALLSLLVVTFPLLIGYRVGVTRNVMNGVERPLPEWDDFGKLFMDGLNVFIAQFVYTLPFWLIMCIGFFATIGFGGLSEAINEDVLAAGFLATWGIIGCLFFILAIAWVFLGPAIIIQYVRHENLGACFRFSEVLGIARENIGDFLIVVLAVLGTNIILNSVSGTLFLIPCLGWIASPILTLVGLTWLAATGGHLYGQIAAGKAATF
jgi:hypothetical protein